MENVDDENIIKKQHKTINSISRNEDFQFVLAFVYHYKYKAIPVSNLRFDNFFTKFDETNSNTNIYFYKDIPFNSIITMISKLLPNCK